ncbi:MAG TPA: amylo-alpha-1,6-glucosidase [Thermoanaerobaculia bacterium]|nr:amylo-alpha-1,6-glucosidase [Thermoanaerobaculia bacterium]
MSIQLDREITQDFERALGVEWLETNGLGGWAGTTVAGAHSRRYHGLLVAATRPPAGRTVLLSRLDETLHVEGATYELGCNLFPGAVAPRGFEYLASFSQGLFPQFTYEAGGVRLRKTVAAVDGENTTLVLYEVLQAPGPFILSLRPFLAARDLHSLTSANDVLSQEVSFTAGVLELQPYPEAPEVFVQVPGADFQANPQWWYHFEYERDRQRGFDFQEDLWTPGLFGRELAPGDRLGIVISTADPQGRDAFSLFEKERKRREKILKTLPVQDDFARSLALAADSFLVRRGTNQRAVVAGYPWFTERSRDTMIALPGLCLVTGRFEDAKKILRAFAKSVSQGMLPDRLPEKGEEARYTSVDASLWLFVAAWKYLEATGDEDFVREALLLALRKVVHGYDKGTRHGIKTAGDGLLATGETDVPLTWMDGRIGDRPVTPRRGKAVEVNALWANALTILAELEARLGDPEEAKRLTQRAKRVRTRFAEAFWNEEGGFLYDVIGDEPDASLRPNQIFALSLPFPLLPKPKAERVLAAVEEKLATPVGLRTLAPDHPDYHAVYEGDPMAREGAYHQGTVWTWLLGPYMTALVRVQGAAGRKKALGIVRELQPRLAEAGVGSLPDVFDAEPPHSPRGCFARAWSVAEVLRACVEDLQAPARPKKEKKL